MTPDPTLTDEELAETEAYYGVEGTTWFDPDIARLIAALRASREEVGRLRAEVNRLTHWIGSSM